MQTLQRMIFTQMLIMSRFMVIMFVHQDQHQHQLVTQITSKIPTFMVKLVETLEFSQFQFVFFFKLKTDHEIEVNWCPPNRPPHFAQSTSYKDPNQVTVTNDNESNQTAVSASASSCAAAAVVGDNQNSSMTSNHNSLENTRHHSITEGLPTPMNITDENKEANSHISTVSERGSDAQPKSITSEYESIPSIENKDCEYLKLVMAFKRTLVLPDVFFSYDLAVCHCILCMSSGGRNLLEGNLEST